MWKYLSHHAIYQLFITKVIYIAGSRRLHSKLNYWLESIHINLDLYNKYIEKKQENLVDLIYNYLTICKWVVYEFCFWNKKQIRNKNGFLGKSSFFCLHYFSFLSLACNQSTNPSYYYAFSSWFNICFFIYPGIRSEKRKVLFSMIDINMCKVKNNHPSNQIFVYF